MMDVPIFLRVPREILRQRREERSGYHTAEGSFWRDPPGYWEQVVYPAYTRAHASVFQDGDVENGAAAEKVKGLVLVDGMSEDMNAIVDRVCETIELRSGR